MPVRTYLVLLISACCACGLAVFYSLNELHQEASVSSMKLTDGELALRDLQFLERSFSQLLVLSDLVFGSDQTYLCAGAIELAKDTGELSELLGDKLKIIGGVKSKIAVIESFVMQQKKRLQQAMEINFEDREKKLSALLEQMDEGSIVAVEAMQSLRSLMVQRLDRVKAELKALHKDHVFKRGALLIMFLSAVLVLWLWISQMLSQPISLLTKDLKVALLSDGDIDCERSGPLEVTDLRSTFSDLIGSLREKQAQKQIEREGIHQNMVEVSRKAGMAQVASEVLHNVGNVLTSMNVSATISRNKLEKSVLQKLVAARDIIQSQKDNLADFLTNHSQGKHFPNALNHVTNALINENRNLKKEAYQLIENIDHVRQIINTQQEFARGDGMLDTYCLADVIENSLQITSETLAINNIQVVRDYSKLINLRTDRHKLQQVLVNLISNARDSIIEHDGKREISISVSEVGDDLLIDVKDTGMGIAAENMSNIFSYGFTTKEAGHGFGLHFSALAAQVLGGSIKVASDGEGHGATFSLRLPQEQEELCKV